MRKRTNFIFLILVITVGFAAYSNSLTNKFLWDDELLIVNNEYIKDLHNAPALFTKSITYGSSIESNAYRPLQMLTYALNYTVSKLDVRAYRLTNIAIHILVAIMLYWLTQLVSKNEVLSLITALIFVSHPIHTQAVTYISGRADPLAALFILLSSIFYIKYSHNKNKISFYFLSILSFLLALLSKETALIVPLILLAYDYNYRSLRKVSLKRHTPFFLFGLIYIVLRKTVLNFPVEKTIIDVTTFLERTPVIFKSLTMYFKKLIIPLNLHMEYEPIVPPIADIQVILGLAITSILILTAIMYRKRERLIPFSIAWFFINYLPISNIYPLNAFFAEHWIYTPSLGLFILAGWAVVKIYEKGRILKQPVCLVLATLLVCNFCLTVKQNGHWKEPEHFYKRLLKYSPNSFRVHYRLALLYFRKAMIDKGIEESKKSLKINPDYVPTYENLAAGYIIKGWHDKAIDICEKVLKMNPDSDILHNNLGIAYSAKGRDDKALIEFKKAIAINPNYTEAHNNLGSAYAIMGEREKAIALFMKAIDLNPNYAGAHNNLAKAYYDIRQYELALKHCHRAIELGYKIRPEFLRLLEPYRK